MPTPFILPLTALTPAQLYISQAKLTRVQEWFTTPANMPPITVKKLAGRLLMTDGHTRATAAYLAGFDTVPCTWETGDWDWAIYAADIDLCASEEITTVQALAKRIVSEAEYKKLWIARCDDLYDEQCYNTLRQKDEIIYFTRQTTPELPADSTLIKIRPIDIGVPEGEYYQLYLNDTPAARGCIERYSHEFWEAADIKTFPPCRNQGCGRAITAYLTNKIITSGKTATCRTLPENKAMTKIITSCGYTKLY